MQIDRKSRRIAVEIPVTLTTVLDSFDAVIVDLSTQGAQIAGCALGPGTRFHIEYMGQTIFALCRWSEVDRVGAQFSYPLVDGPLHDCLVAARGPRHETETKPTISQPALVQQTRPVLRSFGRAQMGFGRRTG